MIALDLQRFADGGAAGGSSAATSAEGTGVTGDAADLIQDYRQKRSKGKPAHDQARTAAQPIAATAQPAQAPGQPQEAQRPASAETAPAEETPEDRKAKFKALLEGEYKSEAQEWAQSTIKERLKGAKEAEAVLNKLQPALEALITKHGLESGDLDGLVKKITDDDSIYEDEALERGIPVETLKEMKALERQSKEYQRMQAENQQRQLMQAHFQKLSEQANAAKQLYPGFDLRQELANPTFARLTHPSVGIDVRTAYEIAHRDEIQPRAMAAVAQQTQQKISASVQAGASRVSENGLKPSGGAVSLSDDPRNWSRAERQKIAERARRGERITF
jgi:hypothetical protein